MTILLRYKDVDPQTLNPHIFVATGERHIYPNETTGKTLTREALNAYVSSQIEAGKPAYLNAVVLASDTYTDASDTSNSKLPAVICRIPGFDAVPPPTKLHCQGTSPSDQNIANGIFYKLSGFLTQGIIAADWNAIFNHTLYLTYGGSGGDLNLVPGNVVKVTFSDFEMKSRPEILGLNTDIAFIFPEYQTTSPREAHKPAPPTPKPEPTQKPEEEPEEPPQTTPAETPEPPPKVTDGPLKYKVNFKTPAWAKWGYENKIKGANGKPLSIVCPATAFGKGDTGRNVPKLESILPMVHVTGIHPTVLGAISARESNGGDPSGILCETYAAKKYIRIYAPASKRKQYMDIMNKRFPPRTYDLGTITGKANDFGKVVTRHWWYRGSPDGYWPPRFYYGVGKSKSFRYLKGSTKKKFKLTPEKEAHFANASVGGDLFLKYGTNPMGNSARLRGFDGKSGETQFNFMWNNVAKWLPIMITSFGPYQCLGVHALRKKARERQPRYYGTYTELSKKLIKAGSNTLRDYLEPAVAIAFLDYFTTNSALFANDMLLAYIANQMSSNAGPTSNGFSDAATFPFGGPGGGTSGRTEFGVSTTMVSGRARPTGFPIGKAYTWGGKKKHKASLRADKRVDTWFLLQAVYGGHPTPWKAANNRFRILKIAKLYNIDMSGPPLAWKPPSGGPSGTG